MSACLPPCPSHGSHSLAAPTVVHLFYVGDTWFADFSAFRAAKAAAKADKERAAAEAKAEKKRIADEKAR